jgi:hypothetical protein
MGEIAVARGFGEHPITHEQLTLLLEKEHVGILDEDPLGP